MKLMLTQLSTKLELKLKLKLSLAKAVKVGHQSYVSDILHCVPILHKKYTLNIWSIQRKLSKPELNHNSTQSQPNITLV